MGKFQEEAMKLRKNIDAVYEAGKAAAGGDSHYDEFWDNYQDNGERTNSECMFGGYGWTAETLKPKYGVTVKASQYMFAYCAYDGDLDDAFEKRGVPLVWELEPDKAQGYQFYSSSIKAIGTVDFSPLNSANHVTSAFNTGTLVTIRNLIPPQVAMTTTCWGSGLTNLGVGGTITYSINLSRCSKLTDDSVQSVIDHLADLTGQTAQTLTFNSTISNKLTSAQIDAATLKNWNVV